MAVCSVKGGGDSEEVGRGGGGLQRLEVLQRRTHHIRLFWILLKRARVGYAAQFRLIHKYLQGSGLGFTELGSTRSNTLTCSFKRMFSCISSTWANMAAKS